MKTNRSNTFIVAAISWVLTSYAATVTVAAACSESRRIPLRTLSLFQALIHTAAGISIPLFGCVTAIGIVFSLAIMAGGTGWEKQLEDMLSAWLTLDRGSHLAIGVAAFIGHTAMMITGFIGIIAVGWRMQTTLTGWVITISMGMLVAGIFWLGCQIGVALSKGNA